MDRIDKEKYFQEAEEYLKDKKLECLKVDHDRFALCYKDGMVKIFFHPFHKKTVSRVQLLRAKETPGIVITNDRYSPRKKGETEMFRENGYLLIKIHSEDVLLNSQNIIKQEEK